MPFCFDIFAKRNILSEFKLNDGKIEINIPVSLKSIGTVYGAPDQTANQKQSLILKFI